MSAPRRRMTADEFGMGNPGHDLAPGEPQTARSMGMGAAWADLANVADLASLAAGRRRHAYRMAADAVDHLIALMDALEADTEDLEPNQDGGEQDDACDYEDDGLAEPSLASPERHPIVPRWSTPGLYVDRGPDSSQLRWTEGAQHDGEAVNEDGDDLDVGEHDESDKEPSIGWPNGFTAIVDFSTQYEMDLEEVDEDGEDHAVPCGHPLASKMVGEGSRV